MTFSPRYIISHDMRTISEHISGQIRRVGKRFKRFARAAIGRVRTVLKRVRGGVRHRHMEEASICAPAIAERCHTEKAEVKRGLPSGKPVKFVTAPFARDVSARWPFALSFQTQINSLRASDKREAGNESDITPLPPEKSVWQGAPFLTV